MANKIVNIKSFLQVDSLTRAEQLLTKDYVGAQISMTADEVDPRDGHRKPIKAEDEIIYAHGTYMIAVNPNYNKYSNPDDKANYDPSHTTPAFEGDLVYDAKLDKSSGDAEYYPTCNEKYYFQPMKGAGTVNYGHNWVNDGSALIVDGDNCTLAFACHWEESDVPAAEQDYISWPDCDEYAPEIEDPSNPGTFIPNPDYHAEHDYTTATWDGKAHGYVDDLFDRNVIIGLPLPIAIDQGKVVFAHTNSVMSIAEKLVLDTDVEKYENGDTVYIATAATDLPADPNEDVNWSKVEVPGTFDVAIILDTDSTSATYKVNSDKFVGVINRKDPTQGILNIPDEALEVTTLIGNASFQKQLLKED